MRGRTRASTRRPRSGEPAHRHDVDPSARGLERARSIGSSGTTTCTSNRSRGRARTIDRSAWSDPPAWATGCTMRTRFTRAMLRARTPPHPRLHSRAMTAPTIGLIAEQLLQRPPGGIGTYVRGLLGALPDQGVRVRPVTARHPRARARRGRSRRPDRDAPAPPRPVRVVEPPRPSTDPRRSRPDPRDEPRVPRRPTPPRRDRPRPVLPDVPGHVHPRGVAFHERGLPAPGTARRSSCALRGGRRRAPRPSRRHPPTSASRPSGATCTRRARPTSTPRRAPCGCTRPYVLSLATREPRKNLDGAIHAFAHARRADSTRPPILVLAGPPGWGDDPVPRRSRPPAWRTTSVRSGSSPRSTRSGSSRAPPRCCSRASPRGSGSRRSRRWPSGPRWSRATARRSPSWSATPRSPPTPPTPRRSPPSSPGPDRRRPRRGAPRTRTRARREPHVGADRRRSPPRRTATRSRS